jgi:hypothetical protein
MQTRFIKPAPGLKVRKPDGGELKAEGEKVEINSYWLRRLADGDVSARDTVPGARGAADIVPAAPKKLPKE